jgi:polyisoprenoid-binding protein YceI
MKNNLKQNLVLIIFCILGFGNILYSQSVYKINDSKDIDLRLSGTSTLHKWTMNARTFTGEAQFVFKPGNDNQLTSLKSLTFSLVVQNLKSDEKKLDKNAYKALKTDRYKDIYYKLKSSKVIPQKENKYLIQAHGNLSIAGVTKEVTMDVYCVVNKDETITCTGSDKLKMSDYQVKPPTFMLGAMKTGDAITLDFTLVYKK